MEGTALPAITVLRERGLVWLEVLGFGLRISFGFYSKAYFHRIKESPIAEGFTGGNAASTAWCAARGGCRGLWFWWRQLVPGPVGVSLHFLFAAALSTLRDTVQLL